MEFLLFVVFLAIALFVLVRVVTSFFAPPQSTRRKLMISSWGPPSEGNIHGVMEMDVTRSLEYIQELRAKTGKKITITHVILKAISLGIRTAPSLNGRLVCDHFLPHATIDIGCLVNIEGGKDLANAKITDSDKRTIEDICDIVSAKSDSLRKGKDSDFNKMNETIRALPVFIIRPLAYLTGLLSSAFGLDIPFLGIRPFPFGSCLVTSVGMMNLDMAFIPFTPFARVPLAVMIGTIRDKAVVIDKQIVIRPMLTMTATVDHRFVDGAQCALLARKVKEVIEKPEAFDFNEIESDDSRKKK